ncbi:ankyrin repeat protein, putative [Trichomonas vaginalis G3]|uniref:Ankyrin repeat protein, putative n=1 Tax=Trichomonas vaginalis (strain ATCC PRA-98 / G3) TaxID=412133 RepID=A2EDQ6_TRIV3|nr:cyclin-dependent kinase inhibitor 2C-related family [Trichomonas vaginalis G3]EAY09221.1 ankyrin repeat protein, putative [Trichomonas vaginalis G3]KAI5486802.1 cyclin-dependent kinase inhibitor 2C-related family [Trichomonas vaginalis G3]|eukprot:XP_001321444.1 ankyrin repeat protein [Trichomonas vaginalis G3]
MSCGSLAMYQDFIGFYDRLFHIKSNEAVEEMINLISSILITKYKMSFHALFKSIFRAMHSNYRSINVYVQILNQILTKFSLKKSEFVYRDDDFFDESNIFNLKQDIVSSFPKEGEIGYMIMHDQIDCFKEYISNHSLAYLLMFCRFKFSPFQQLSLLEACCYFGSVNIFFFLISNAECIITQECLKASIFGGNTDIINECMKKNQIDKYCVNSSLVSHNNQFFEYILENVMFTSNFKVESTYCSDDDYSDNIVYIDHFDFEDYFDHECIIESQNLNAVLLLYMKDKNLIFPWCAAFPQLLDIIRKESMNDYDLVLDLQFLHYAIENASIETVKFVISQNEGKIPEYINLDSLLLYAAEKDSKEIAEFLLSHGADKDADSDEVTPLYVALINNSFETAEILISNGANVNIWIAGRTAFNYALYKNAKEIAKLIVLHGADINKKDNYGSTALHCAAAEFNDKEILEFLISHGADINIKDQYGKTALHYAAAKCNDKEILEFLISHGADINIKDQYGKTALYYAAAKCNDKEILEFLISHDEDINMKDEYKRIVFHHIVLYNNKASLECFISHVGDNNSKDDYIREAFHYGISIEIAEFLISQGADINARDNFGKTLLHYAVDHDNQEMMKFLILQNADVNIKDNDGMAPIHYADNKETIEYLILHGADIISVNNGMSALHCAAKNNKKGFIEYLILHGANVNVKDENGKTPLHFAAEFDRLETAKFLISNGADINAKDKFGRTALHYAATLCINGLAYYLILLGANINVKDENEKTPLHLAAEFDRREEVELLFSYGAEINAKDKEAKTPLDYAVQRKGHNVINYLEGVANGKIHAFKFLVDDFYFNNDTEEDFYFNDIEEDIYLHNRDIYFQYSDTDETDELTEEESDA